MCSIMCCRCMALPIFLSIFSNMGRFGGGIRALCANCTMSIPSLTLFHSHVVNHKHVDIGTVEMATHPATNSFLHWLQKMPVYSIFPTMEKQNSCIIHIKRKGKFVSMVKMNRTKITKSKYGKRPEAIFIMIMILTSCWFWYSRVIRNMYHLVLLSG